MPSNLIHKNLLREICRFGDQNMSKLLEQKMNPEAKLDVELLREKISYLKHTAAQNGLVSLSAPQIKMKNRIFVIMKQQFLRYSQWTGYEDLFMTKKPEECYDAIINPELVGYSDFKIKGSEECPSIEGMKFKVWIPLINKMRFIKYLELTERKGGPAFKNCEESLTGFYGRVFDHEYRHLEGLLVNVPEISNNEVYLTNDAMDDPENFDQLRNYKMEAKFFEDENLDKYLEKEKNRLKQEESQKMNPVASFKKDFMNMPDQIDEKIREKLKRSYEMVKAKTSEFSPFKANPKSDMSSKEENLKNKSSKHEEKSKKSQGKNRAFKK